LMLVNMPVHKNMSFRSLWETQQLLKNTF